MAKRDTRRHGRSITPSQCIAKNKIIYSRAAKLGNDLLGVAGGGVLLRAPDVLDSDFQKQAHFIPTEKWPNQDPQLLPASFLHLSMRAPNPMYHGKFPVGVLIGSKLTENAAYVMQSKPVTTPLVNISVCYPGDAGTLQRPSKKYLTPDGNETPSVLLTPHGGGCHMTKSICKNETCLFRVEDDCRCTDASLLNGETHGTLLTHLARNESTLYTSPTFMSCWFEMGDRMDELWNASNSLWLERNQWCKAPKPFEYQGWTECPTSSNVDSVENIDAIVIGVPPTANKSVANLCEFPDANRPMWIVLKRLRRYLERYGFMPVVFMGQTRGMPNQEACDKYWGGEQCDNGYYKYFFSQPYQFNDGSCLAQPPNCDDIYYFQSCDLIITPNRCLEKPVSIIQKLQSVSRNRAKVGTEFSLMQPYTEKIDIHLSDVYAEQILLTILSCLIIYLWLFTQLRRRLRSKKR